IETPTFNFAGSRDSLLITSTCTTMLSSFFERITIGENYSQCNKLETSILLNNLHNLNAENSHYRTRFR
ncbi:MAG TPA: hypothetical protein PLI53_05565, partial [Geobacteraceae bacterium]|nr:hypothetical protein [Geobacteraceae bacterium]